MFSVQFAVAIIAFPCFQWLHSIKSPRTVLPALVHRCCLSAMLPDALKVTAQAAVLFDEESDASEKFYVAADISGGKGTNEKLSMLCGPVSSPHAVTRTL